MLVFFHPNASDVENQIDTSQCEDGHTFRSNVGKASAQGCNDSGERKLKWHEFDWQLYITEDLKPAHRFIV